jgi:hypothetical protein
VVRRTHTKNHCSKVMVSLFGLSSLRPFSLAFPCRRGGFLSPYPLRPDTIYPLALLDTLEGQAQSDEPVVSHGFQR